MDIREEGRPFSAKDRNGVGCLVMQGLRGQSGVFAAMQSSSQREGSPSRLHA